MAAEENKGKGTSGTTGSTTGGQATGKASTGGGGQQISGEQIFTTTEQGTGGESFATTGAGTTGSSTTGGGASGGESQANLADAVSGVVSGDTGKAKEMLNQAKSATGQVASQAAGQVREKASTFVDTKTSDLARSITPLVDSLRQFTENIRNNAGDQQAPIAQTVAQYGETVTSQVERLAGYLDRADLDKLTRDAESFARRNPAVFIGSAFALGILAARFIRSSQQRAMIPPSRQLEAGTGGSRGISTTQGSSSTVGTTSTITGGTTGTGTGASDEGTTPAL